LPNPNTWTILTPNVNSAIDPSITYYRGYYYLAFKDEINCTINIYKSSAITGPYTNTNITIPIYGLEAPYLIANNTSLYLYANGYCMYPKTKNNAINDSNFYSGDAIYWSSCLFRLYYFDTQFLNQKAYPVLLPQTPHLAYHIFTSNKLLMALSNVSGIPVTYNLSSTCIIDAADINGNTINISNLPYGYTYSITGGSISSISATANFSGLFDENSCPFAIVRNATGIANPTTIKADVRFYGTNVLPLKADGQSTLFAAIDNSVHCTLIN
jgi:hypothetical protein